MTLQKQYNNENGLFGPFFLRIKFKKFKLKLKYFN